MPSAASGLRPRPNPASDGNYDCYAFPGKGGIVGMRAVPGEPNAADRHYVGMQAKDDVALALLQTLLRIAVDSAEGYATAGRDAQSPELIRLFQQYHNDRLKLIDELKARIRDFRADPEAKATMLGAAHRAWIDASAGTSENPDHALLTEVERGEDLAVAAFRDALAERELDAITRHLLERHYEKVQAAHDRVRQLRDRPSYANR
jgi:uncharacterized protein (TIGR02284 family)